MPKGKGSGDSMKRKTTAQAATGKEQEIALLLSQGTTPSGLVKQGFARGTVYKVAKRVGKKADTEGTLPEDHPPTDTEIESDPEIVRLRKDLRKKFLSKRIIRKSKNATM